MQVCRDRSRPGNQARGNLFSGNRAHGHYQWAQPYTRLYSNGAAAGVDSVIEMWREKDMPVGPRDVIKAFELQRCAPP